MSKLRQAAQEYNELKAKFQEQIQGIMKDAFKEFFEKYPEFQAIAWTQYTPYFNDGDPCEFSRHEFFYLLTPEFYGEELDEDQTLEDFVGDADPEDYAQIFPSIGDWVWNRMKEDPTNKYCLEAVDTFRRETAALDDRSRELAEAWSEFERDLNLVDEEIYQEVFGDHVKVIATRDNFKINEYYHD